MNCRGSCLCGKVHFEIDSRVRRFYFCHCEQCRKLTGSAHAANLLSQPAEIRWLQGEKNVRRYDDANGRQFSHVFCVECGSALPFLNLSATALIIPAGSLDSPVDMEVTHNIFWGEAADWYEAGLQAPRCSAFPED